MNPAMWISKTGVQAQDAKLQAIANNLANVNTVGFKRDDVERARNVLSEHAQSD